MVMAPIGLPVALTGIVAGLAFMLALVISLRMLVPDTANAAIAVANS